MYQISRQGREAIVLTFRPAVFDFHILAVDEADLIQALTNAGTTDAASPGDLLSRNPITGVSRCCARHPAAAPPRVNMNSRRRMWIAMLPLPPEVVCTQ
jgi:hypothetical protein